MGLWRPDLLGVYLENEMATTSKQPPQAGARIVVPAGLYAPISYARVDDGERCDRGTIIESGHLVVVQFDGYPNLVDYSAREAALFEVVDVVAFPVRCQYAIVGFDESRVWITDVGRDVCSVTNDAERVCLALVERYGDKRIIYRDSTGAWDELVHVGGRFTGFAPARDQAPAHLSCLPVVQS